MAYKLIATVKFNNGTTSVLKARSTAKRGDLEELLVKMGEIIQSAYRDKSSAQLTVGTTMVNVLDTSSIDLKLKWSF